MAVRVVDTNLAPAGGAGQPAESGMAALEVANSNEAPFHAESGDNDGEDGERQSWVRFKYRHPTSLNSVPAQRTPRGATQRGCRRSWSVYRLPFSHINSGRDPNLTSYKAGCAHVHASDNDSEIRVNVLILCASDSRSKRK